MSDREDILWSLQRQNRTLEEVLGDARLVWRDANAKAADQKFLQPGAAAQSAILAALAAQHRGLDSATNDLARADEQYRTACAQSAQVGESSTDADQKARTALGEAATARSHAQQTDQLAADARAKVSQASAAGGG